MGEVKGKALECPLLRCHDMMRETEAFVTMVEGSPHWAFAQERRPRGMLDHSEKSCPSVLPWRACLCTPSIRESRNAILAHGTYSSIRTDRLFVMEYSVESRTDVGGGVVAEKYHMVFRKSIGKQAPLVFYIQSDDLPNSFDRKSIQHPQCYSF
jgi:hypothetical protein